MRIMTDKMIFCTLFDSNYLDKGLALYWSMKDRITGFKLYIFAFDDKCYEILKKMHLKNVVLVSWKDIMTESLHSLQCERSRAEFCWTCTPLIIEFVLLRYGEKICTYIDADIYFFSSPERMLQEMVNSGCSVGLVEHRFKRDCEYGMNVFLVGKYCIQFNTFLNNKEGRRVLNDWKESCMTWCYRRYDDGKFGDQKYPDKWKQKYNSIFVYQDLGLGIAPWNLHLYKYISKKNNNLSLKHKGKLVPLIFYHFEGMEYLDDGRVYLNIWKSYVLGTNRKMKLIYGEYLKRINIIRKKLNASYGITFDHMLVEKSLYFGKKHSLIEFCKNNGVINGVAYWLAHWKNNAFSLYK